MAEGPRRRSREADARRLLREDGRHLRGYRSRGVVVGVVGIGGLAAILAVAIPPGGRTSPLAGWSDAALVVTLLSATLLYAVALVWSIVALGGPAFSVRVLLEEGVPRPRIRAILQASRSGTALRRAVEREVAPLPEALPVTSTTATTATSAEVLYRERRWLAELGIGSTVVVAVVVALGASLATWRAGDGLLTPLTPLAGGVAALGHLVLGMIPVGQRWSSVVVRPGRLSVWSVPRRIDLDRVLAYGPVDLEELRDHVHRSQWHDWRTFSTWRPWVAVAGGWYAIDRCAVLVRSCEHPPAGLVWLTELRPDGRPLGWLVGTRDPDALLAALERAGTRGRRDLTPLPWRLDATEDPLPRHHGRTDHDDGDRP